MREEEKQTSLKSKWKKATKKKWVLPAIYIGSAAILIAGVLWFQAINGNLLGNETDNITDVADDQYPNFSEEQEAVPVNVAVENFKMPVLDEKAVTIKKQFYDNDASSEEQEAALVVYNNTYYPNTGIDIAMESGDSFDVVASLSGTVTRAENDPILGNVVEIEHDNDVVTFYQSLDAMHVEVGTEVVQGEVIGTAGTSEYNKDAGVHVHFEIRQNNQPVNPVEFFNKPLSSLEGKADTNANTDTKKANDPTQTEDATQSEDAAIESDQAEADKAPESTDDAAKTEETKNSVENPADVKEQPANDESTDEKADQTSDKDASIGMANA